MTTAMRNVQTRGALPDNALPVIDAGRFVLRPLRASDAGLLAHYAGDARVAQSTRSIPHPLPPGTAEAFIARSAAPGRSEDSWAMDGSGTGLAELLGVLTLRPLSADADRASADGRKAETAGTPAEAGKPASGQSCVGQSAKGQSEISYWVAPAFWNAGYASDAVRAVMAANPRGDGSVVAAVFQDNPASARVLSNAGFDYLGDAEAFSVARGAMVRTWTYIRKL